MELTSEQMADCQYIAQKVSESLTKEMVAYLSHDMNKDISVNDATLIPVCIVSMIVASTANALSYHAHKEKLNISPDDLINVIGGSARIFSDAMKEKMKSLYEEQGIEK